MLNFKISILLESMQRYQAVQSSEGMKKVLHLLG